MKLLTKLSSEIRSEGLATLEMKGFPGSSQAPHQQNIADFLALLFYKINNKIHVSAHMAFTFFFLFPLPTSAIIHKTVVCNLFTSASTAEENFKRVCADNL